MQKIFDCVNIVRKASTGWQRALVFGSPYACSCVTWMTIERSCSSVQRSLVLNIDVTSDPLRRTTVLKSTFYACFSSIRNPRVPRI